MTGPHPPAAVRSPAASVLLLVCALVFGCCANLAPGRAKARELTVTATAYNSVPEQTEVMALPANAAADAVAALVPYWLTGMIPRVHLDVAVPLVNRETKSSAEVPRSTSSRG